VVVLLALAVGVAFFPGQVPGLTTPGTRRRRCGAMDSMPMHETPMQGMSP